MHTHIHTVHACKCTKTYCKWAMQGRMIKPNSVLNIHKRFPIKSFKKRFKSNDVACLISC